MRLNSNEVIRPDSDDRKRHIREAMLRYAVQVDVVADEDNSARENDADEAAEKERC